MRQVCSKHRTWRTIEGECPLCRREKEHPVSHEYRVPTAFDNGTQPCEQQEDNTRNGKRRPVPRPDQTELIYDPVTDEFVDKTSECEMP